MTRDVNLGLRFVATATLVYALAFAAIYIGRDAGIKTYPRYLIPIAAMLPLFFATFFATHFINAKPERMTRREIITFGLISTVGCFVTSTLAEAHFMYAALATGEDITFTDVLFAPLDARYAMPVLFGASFAVSTTIVVAYVTFLRVPATMHVRLRKAQGT